MGGIIDRNGTLQFDFRYDGFRIRESSKLAANKVNRRVCAEKMRKIEAEIALGVFDPVKHFPDSQRLRDLFGHASNAPQRIPVFKDFAEIWFAEKAIEWRQSYADTIRVSLETHLYPAFSRKRLTVISKAEILEFRANLARMPGQGDAATLSASRINHIMTPLRMILTEASDRYDFINPWRNIKPLKEPRTKVEPFTLDEVKAIIRTVRSDYRPYYTVRFFTGLRSSEIHGLRWQHVDFERRQILVREALVQGRMVPTKTDGSVRDVDMNSLVYEALTQQAKVSRHYSEFVFASRLGTPLINQNTTRRIWYPLLKSLGLKARRPYQTRHTAATLWLASGEAPEWIARQMGHTTTEMLFRVYSRYVPNLTRQDGSAFEQLLATRFALSSYDASNPF